MDSPGHGSRVSQPKRSLILEHHIPELETQRRGFPLSHPMCASSLPLRQKLRIGFKEGNYAPQVSTTCSGQSCRKAIAETHVAWASGETRLLSLQFAGPSTVGGSWLSLGPRVKRIRRWYHPYNPKLYQSGHGREGKRDVLESWEKGSLL